MNSKGNELWEAMKMVNDATQAGIEADRLSDDRLGLQLDKLSTVSEISHSSAYKALQMILLRYGTSHLVPHSLYEAIAKAGRRLDNTTIDLKVAKEFPEFEIPKDPEMLQRRYQKTKHNWNSNVFQAIRMAQVSTKSPNAQLASIQLIAAQRNKNKEEKEEEFDFI